MTTRSTLLVTTYNWPQALQAVLASVRRQATLPDEVVIADDGSREDTRELLLREARDFPTALRHVWQEDRGFRAASSRNRALAASRGDYIVMIDGDMVLHPDFVADHLALAQVGGFLQGGRIQATTAWTKRLLDGATPRFHPFVDADFHAQHGDDRHHAIHNLALARKKAESRNAGSTVMSCNLSAWRKDIVAANGFDERMEGYGSEDLELDLRLRNAGLRRRRLKFAGLAIHLMHLTRAPADPEDAAAPNNCILRKTAETGATRCELGMDRYAAEYATPPPDLRTLSPTAIPARTAGGR
ncbi:glycosyltransferase family 2 protein [Solilutibacter silvestris]|uniref:glycosyltransferase family 2 protein n=1 Tax=Solilutibacter silvestris TaxID=1645665 RepID=UPI003D34A076